MRFLSLFLALAFLSFPAVAAQGLKEGQAIPTNLELKDAKGGLQSFDTIKGEKGAVLFFIRSADWCPYCQVQLLDLRQGMADSITDAGYNIVVISYDAPEALDKFATKYKFPFTILSDEESKTINAFGILDETKKEGAFGHGIPRPHVYVVNGDKDIQGILAEESYTRRPEIKDIVEIIQNNN